MTARIKAILFDVGGPLDKEMIMNRMIDEQIIASFKKRGVEISDSEYSLVNDWAVEVFAPKIYQAIIWKIATGDTKLAEVVETELMDTAARRNNARGDFELRQGIPELLQELSNDGLLLGLAANQPTTTLQNMDRLGILQYFSYKRVSGSTGLRKPDLRLLINVCRGLRVSPPEVVMIGDRIDNDIVPARTLGMTTIRFVSGRHSKQQPRSRYETPNTDVRSVQELRTAIKAIVSNPPAIFVDTGPE